MANLSQAGMRLAFKNARARVVAAGKKPSEVVLCQGVLRLEQTINTSSTTYNFQVVQNSSAVQPTNTSVLLALQDAFFVSQLGIYLAVPSSSTATNYRLLTYPSVGTITNVAGNFTAAQATDALSLYNGVLQLTVNQRTILTSWDIQKHLFIPPTQVNAFSNIKTGATTAVVAPEHYNDDFYNASEHGMYPVEPNVVLNGKDKNDLSIVLPSAIASAPATARIIVLFRGVLAQNMNKFN